MCVGVCVCVCPPPHTQTSFEQHKGNAHEPPPHMHTLQSGEQVSTCKPGCSGPGHWTISRGWTLDERGGGMSVCVCVCGVGQRERGGARERERGGTRARAPEKQNNDVDAHDPALTGLRQLPFQPPTGYLNLLSGCVGKREIIR